MTYSTGAEITRILGQYNFQHQLNNHYIALYCLNYYASANHASHHPVVSKLVRDIKVIKRFSSKINSILYQTNLSNLVVVNAFRYYKLVIDKQRQQQDCVKFFYKNMQDNLLIIFLVCLMISNKTYDDSSFTSKTWSNLSKFPLKKLNLLEIQILGSSILNFDVFYSSFRPQTFLQWALECVNEIDVLQKVLIRATGSSSSSFGGLCSSTLSTGTASKSISGNKKLNSRKISINNLVSKDNKPPGYSMHTTPLLNNNKVAGSTYHNSNDNNSFYSITPHSSTHSVNHQAFVTDFAKHPNSTFTNVDPVTNSPSYIKSTKQYVPHSSGGSGSNAHALLQLYTPPMNDGTYSNQYKTRPNPLVSSRGANGAVYPTNGPTNGTINCNRPNNSNYAAGINDTQSLSFNDAYPTPEFHLQNFAHVVPQQQQQQQVLINHNPMVTGSLNDTYFNGNNICQAPATSYYSQYNQPNSLPVLQAPLYQHQQFLPHHQQQLQLLQRAYNTLY